MTYNKYISGGQSSSLQTDFVRVELGATDILDVIRAYTRSHGPLTIKSPLLVHSSHTPDVHSSE